MSGLCREDIPKLTRFYEAYLAMAQTARYRPAAPGDGCGGLYLTKAELADPMVLAAEAKKYAVAFCNEEDSLGFAIGCTNYETNRATIYAIEAARQMCGGTDGNMTALRLLTMALAELKAAMGPAGVCVPTTPI